MTSPSELTVRWRERGDELHPYAPSASAAFHTAAAELEAAQARVRDLDDEGALDAFVARHDARRTDIGQITFLFATLG